MVGATVNAVVATEAKEHADGHMQKTQVDARARKALLTSRGAKAIKKARAASGKAAPKAVPKAGKKSQRKATTLDKAVGAKTPKPLLKKMFAKQAVDMTAYKGPLEEVDPDAESDCFLTFMEKKLNFLKKIHPGISEDTLRAYRMLAVAGHFNDTIPLKIGKTVKPVKGASLFLQFMKLESYRQGRCAPRPSDEDFAGATDLDAVRLALEKTLDTVDDDGDGDDAIASMSEESDCALNDQFEASKAALGEMAKYFRDNKPSDPVACQPVGAQAVSEVMMASMSEISSAGGCLSTKLDGMNCLLKPVVEMAMQRIPEEWEKAAVVYDKLVGRNLDQLMDPAIKETLSTCKISIQLLVITRIQLIAHVVEFMGKQCFMLRDGPSISPCPYWPELLVSMMSKLKAEHDAVKFSNDPSHCSKTFVKHLLASNLAFPQFFINMVEEGWKIAEHCTTNDGMKHKANKESMRRQLAEISKAKPLQEFIRHHLNKDVHVKSNIHLFPLEFTKIVSDFFVEYDKAHADEVYAESILQDPYACLVSVLEKKFAEETAIVPTTKPVSELAHSSKGSVKSWWAKLVESEKMTGIPINEENAIVSAIQAHLHTLPATAYVGDSMDSWELRDEAALKRGNGSAIKPKTTPKESFMIVRVGDGGFECPFWGRVIVETAAANVSRANIMPLIPRNDDDDGLVLPRLYIDGSAFLNGNRSNACLPFLIKKLPDVKPEDPIPADTPAFKKRRLEIAAEERRTKVPIATHFVEFRDVSVNVCLGTETKCVTYGMPIMKSFPGAALDKKCYREKIAFDDATLNQAPKVKAASGFIFK